MEELISFPWRARKYKLSRALVDFAIEHVPEALFYIPRSEHPYIAHKLHISLRYLDRPERHIQWMAIKLCVYNIYYIVPTPEMQIYVALRHPQYLYHVGNPTVWFAALRENPEAFKYIRNPPFSLCWIMAKKCEKNIGYIPEIHFQRVLLKIQEDIIWKTYAIVHG